MQKIKFILSIVLMIVYQLNLPTVLAAQGTYEEIAVYPRSSRWFTQGFEQISEGKLLMGTGKYGDSVLLIQDLAQNQEIIVDTLPENVFGEGITMTPHGIWQISYKEGKAYLRDLQTYKVLQEASYEGEGWGIAYDEDHQVLWMTNGSAKLQKRDAKTFELLSETEITYEQKPIEWVNELEYVDGRLYANLWQSSLIVVINPVSGKIEHHIDMAPLIQKYRLEPNGQTDVLNGIAHKEGDVFYLTGKYYPQIFEISLKLVP